MNLVKMYDVKKINKRNELRSKLKAIGYSNSGKHFVNTEHQDTVHSDKHLASMLNIKWTSYRNTAVNIYSGQLVNDIHINFPDKETCERFINEYLRNKKLI